MKRRTRVELHDVRVTQPHCFFFLSETILGIGKRERARRRAPRGSHIQGHARRERVRQRVHLRVFEKRAVVSAETIRQLLRTRSGVRGRRRLLPRILLGERRATLLAERRERAEPRARLRVTRPGIALRARLARRRRVRQRRAELRAAPIRFSFFFFKRRRRVFRRVFRGVFFFGSLRTKRGRRRRRRRRGGDGRRPRQHSRGCLRRDRARASFVVSGRREALGGERSRGGDEQKPRRTRPTRRTRRTRRSPPPPRRPRVCTAPRASAWRFRRVFSCLFSAENVATKKKAARRKGGGAAAATTWPGRPQSRWALPSSASTDGGVCGGALRGERRTGDATLACDAVARCAYTEAAPTAAVRGGVVLVDLGVGPPARAGGVSPLSLTLDKTSARSSRAFFVPGVRVGGRASSTSSSAPLWRMKSMASRVAGERGGAAPARVPTQTRPRVGWEASVEKRLLPRCRSLLLFCGLS